MPPRRANTEIPPKIAQLLATQNQLIQLLTQNMQNNNNNPPPPPPPQQDRLTRFLRLNPPTFTSSAEPIIADDWIRTINKKLDIVQAVGADRVRYAAHQLEGPVAEWWDNYQVTHPDIDAITWDQFELAFHTHHVAAGVMTLKRREFRDLHQLHRSVTEYGELFNKLAYYAPDDVSTDAKSQEEFLRGLHDEICIQLVAQKFDNFQELLDRAIVVESKRKSIENCKRKSNPHKHSVPYQKQRNSSPPPYNNNGHNHNGHHHGSPKHNGHKNHNGNGNNGKDLSEVTFLPRE